VGIQPVAISVDTPETNRPMVAQAGYTFPFLSDPNAEAIKRYDLVHAGQGINGQAIARFRTHDALA
jgi:peroxiredoxin